MTGNNEEIIYCPVCGAEGTESIVISEYTPAEDKPKRTYNKISMDEWANRSGKPFTYTHTYTPVKHMKAKCYECGYTVTWTEEYWIQPYTDDDYYTFTGSGHIDFDTFTDSNIYSVKKENENES